MSKVRQILEKKGYDVVTVSPEKTVREAVELMNQHRIGAVVVTEKGMPVGLFSERDLLTRVVSKAADVQRVPVREVMSTPIAYCSPDTEVLECRRAMTQKRIRHLPVVDNGKLVGMLSIGDIMAWELSEQQTTISYLNEYIYGRS